MEIEGEDYREPNPIKPLQEMFTDSITEGSRNNGQTAYRTESRITLPQAYQMTTETPPDILPKLPTMMAAEKSTKKSTTKLTSKVYQVDQDSLKHRCYWNQPPPEDFHWGRRIRGKRSQEKIMGEVRSQPRYPPRCPQSCPPRRSLPRCLPRSQLQGQRC